MNVGGLIREECYGCASPSDTVALYTCASRTPSHAHPLVRTQAHLSTSTIRHFSEMSRHICLVAAAFLAALCVVDAQRRLALPDPRSCANRVRHSTYRDARGVLHSYFFSWEHAPTRNLEVDWLDARNICRRHCMDAVSLETPQVHTYVYV
ncbi:unnamed protein product [Arctia plantaginis]|uniref:Uncharacterized protein n=1 Tax=Arctia plantaginis TaxID=874455 RepID=A0A8S0ZHL4_ARCPL|nr:unnamed protein product [Arctia plantaginis]